MRSSLGIAPAMATATATKAFTSSYRRRYVLIIMYYVMCIRRLHAQSQCGRGFGNEIGSPDHVLTIFCPYKNFFFLDGKKKRKTFL